MKRILENIVVDTFFASSHPKFVILILNTKKSSLTPYFMVKNYNFHKTVEKNTLVLIKEE